MISKRHIVVLGTMLVAVFAYIGYKDAVSISQNLHQQKEQVKTLDKQKVELDQKLKETVKAKQKSQQELQLKEKEKQDLENERKRLEAELQAKVESKRKLAEAQEKEKLAQASTRVINTVTMTETASAAPVPQSGPMGGCGDNQYAAYIYGQESGGKVSGQCNPSAVNGGGCRGIGQACPGGKLPCGADYACQNAYFNSYAISTYGSWANAYNFHITHGWW